MAANASSSDVSDGPVLNVINKRIRALRKKLNRINQMEESVAQGKTLNKEQEEVLRSKPFVIAAIDELEKLRSPLSSALAEELALQHQHQHQPLPPATLEIEAQTDELDRVANDSSNDSMVSDLLNLLYFGSLFDVKSQSDFTATMLTRTHERGCCLTYDYVTDDATDLLGERDLDLISMLGGLMISRPIDSSLSHKNALQQCIEQAKLWLTNSDRPIDCNTNVTYAGLREKLNKIMGSDYFTTTPEMKAPVEMAANYGSFQVPVHGSVMPVSVPVQVEDSTAQYQEKDEENVDFQEHETGENHSSPAEELQKDELEMENPAEGVSVQQEQVKPQAELEHNHAEVESKEQQYIPRRPYQNQRGGRGSGRRGFSNGRGGRGGSRGGGVYQNGRNQYYDQPGNYYPRNYYNNRGRGGRGGGGHSYNNHGSAVQGGYAPADVGVKS